VMLTLLNKLALVERLVSGSHTFLGCIP